MRGKAGQDRRHLVAQDHFPGNGVCGDCWRHTFSRSSQHCDCPTAATARLRGWHLHTGGTVRVRNRHSWSAHTSCIGLLGVAAVTFRRSGMVRINNCTPKAAITKHQPLSCRAPAVHPRQASSQGEGNHHPHQSSPDKIVLAKHKSPRHPNVEHPNPYLC